MACEAGPRRCRHSGEGSRGFAQTLGDHSANGSRARKADAKRAGLGGKTGRNRRQRGAAATGISAAAHHAGVGHGRQRARGVPGRGLGLGGRLGQRGPIRSHVFGGGNRMGVARRRAVRVKAVPLMVSIGPVTDMGVGADRCELNGDQKDRRSDYPPNCSDRSHAQLLLYDPGQVNKRRQQRMKSR